MKAILRFVLAVGLVGCLPAVAQVRPFGLGEAPPPEQKPTAPATPDDFRAAVRALPLQTRVAQLMLVSLQGTPMPDSSDMALLKNYPPGGVVLPAVLRPTTVVTYIAGVRAVTEGKSKSIPPLIGTDLYSLPRQTQSSMEVIGHFTQLPSLLSVGAADDPVITSRYAALIGEFLETMGVNLYLGPPLSLGPVLPEARGSLGCLGDDVDFTGQAGVDIVTALDKAGVIAMPTGFPGGALNRGVQGPAVLLTAGPRVESRDMAPFARAVQSGAVILHVGTTLVPTLDKSGVPACLSSVVMKDYLRGKLGFKGVIVAGPMDSSEVANVEDPTQAAMHALEAGADMLYWNGATPRVIKTVDTIVNATKNGELDEELIRASVDRIVDLKLARALAAQQTPKERQAETLEKRNRFPEETATIERRAITIVQNRDGILPFSKKRSMPLGVTGVVGVEELKLALEKTLKHVSEQEIATARHLGNIEDFEIDRLTRRGATLANVVCVLTPDLKNRSCERLVQGLKEAGMRVTVVLVGYPRDLPRLADADAIVLAYADPTSCAQTMEAVADVLVGNAPIGVAAGNQAHEAVAGQPCVFDANELVRMPAGRLPINAGEAFPAGLGVTYDLGAMLKKAVWDFGDGEHAKELRTKHVYTTPGTYTVTLSATSLGGETATAQTIVNVK